MGLIVTKEEFVGKYAISQNCYTELGLYIDKYEPIILQDLLGCTLFDRFKANLTEGVPTSEIFIKLFEAFCKDYNCDQIRSEGIKEMLLGLIYFEYVRDSAFKATQNGVKTNRVETARSAGFNEHDIYTRYNLSIETYKSIQWCICQNKEDYLDYNGLERTYCHWSF